MKKSLIALAVLAAAGAASAQSSVTLYGIVDAYVGSYKNDMTLATATINGVAGTANPAYAAERQTGVNAAGLSNNRWGLMGTEDLGNGLKANFVLEQGFSVDNGAVAVASGSNLGFNRKATVGVSGSFGAVELGRNYTAYDTLRGVTEHANNFNTSVTPDVWGAGGDYALRVNNSVRYDSPVFSGFSGSVAYGFGENKNLNTDGSVSSTKRDSTDNLSLHVKYVNGPLLVGYAHQSQQAATGKDTKFNLIAGSYDFGVAKLVAGYNTAKRAEDLAKKVGAEDSEYQIGVSAPFGATTVYFGYANSKTESDAGATVEKRSGFDLTATYALSKRTSAYVAYKDAEVKDTDREVKIFGVGVRHAF